MDLVMVALPRIAVLASYNASAFQKMMAMQEVGAQLFIPAIVICNNSRSGALDFATAKGIPSMIINATRFEDVDGTILSCLREHRVDVILLVGYMKKLGPKVLAAYSGRIVNVHPALLPNYGGQGMYGLAPHQAVVAAGETESGATAHLVTQNYDEGPILVQLTVALDEGETPETLQEKVKQLEPLAYLRAIEKLTDNRA
jgi:phosphoribosylglycinamide formyltransferase-1